MVGKYVRLQVQTSSVSASNSEIKTLPVFEASVLLLRILKSNFRDYFLPISGLHTISFALAVHLETKHQRQRIKSNIQSIIRYTNGLKIYTRSTILINKRYKGVNESSEEGFYLSDNHLREPGWLVFGPSNREL